MSVAGELVEHLVTRVSLQGVSDVERGQKIVGAGFRGLQGDIKGASAAFDKLDVATGAYIVGGAAIMGTSLAVGRAMYDTTVRMDSYRQALNSITEDAGETRQQLKELKELAKLPGLGYEEAIKSAVGLEAAGVSFEKTTRYLEEFSNAVALAGNGKEELSAVMYNLKQIMGMGKLTGDELRETSQYVPQLQAALKRIYGTSDTAAIAKMGYSGQEVVDAIVADFEKNLPRAAGSLRTELDNLSDSWSQLLYGSGSKGRGGMVMGVRAVNLVVGALVKLDDITGGMVGTAFMLATGIGVVGGAVLMVLPGVKALKDMWGGVAINAEAAAIAQGKAAVAGVGAGAAAGGGVLAAAKGWILKGVGALAKLGLGTALVALTPMQRDKDRFKPLIPRFIRDYAETKEKTASTKPTGGKNHSEKTNDLLAKLIQLTAEQNRVIVGGGARASRSYNGGDIQRGIYNVLARGMV